MENLNEQGAGEGPSAIYNNVKSLYEEVKLMCKGVLFEIQLDPLDPESEEQSARYIIDFRHCLPNEGDDDGHLTLEDLFSEIDRLQDYKSLLDSALQAIDHIREEYKDTYLVTFLRILQPPEEDEVEIESESEETDESDEEFEADWEAEWDSDSGNESISQISLEESEYDTTWESDSGLQTESESDMEMEPEWESDEEEQPYQPEHGPPLAQFFVQNFDRNSSDEEVSISGATCNDSEDEELDVGDNL